MNPAPVPNIKIKRLKGLLLAGALLLSGMVGAQVIPQENIPESYVYPLYDTAGHVRVGRQYQTYHQETWPHFAGHRLVLPTQDTAWFFGPSPFIEVRLSDTSYPAPLDSIPFADDIVSLAADLHAPAYAVVRSGGKTLLARKSGRQWIPAPVVVARDHALDNGDFLFLLLALTTAVGLTSCLLKAWDISRKLKAPLPEENALRMRSEKPQGLGDPDLLGFDALEDAVAAIIRNPETQLPMTIVISGSWGSGKSSMMNRIREKLTATPEGKKRFMTTWFNAWHLQSESSLLNAFLLSLIRSYERAHRNFFSAFRLRLFGHRFAGLSWFKQFGAGIAATVIVPLLLLLPMKLIPGLDSTPLGHLLDDYCNRLVRMLSDDFFKGGVDTLKRFTALAFAGLSVFFIHRQLMPSALSAFVDLLPKNGFGFSVEKADAGAREKFRSEYWEIMAAGAQGRRHVVFIDDLDRVSGAKVLEILEGINFISDVASRPAESTMQEPNTIFIVGMSMQEVTESVGAQLLEMNQKKGEDADKSKLGNRYMEKMVQLVVPVPFRIEENQVDRLI